MTKRTRLASVVVVLATVPATMGLRRCAPDVRGFTWYGSTTTYELDLLPTTSSALTVDVGGIREGFVSGGWRGDDHSRLVTFDTALPLYSTIDNAYVIEWPWGPGNTGERFVVGGSPGMAVMNIDIGFCSVTAQWHRTADLIGPDGELLAKAGCDVADQIGLQAQSGIVAALATSNSVAFPVGTPQFETRFGVTNNGVRPFGELCIRTMVDLVILALVVNCQYPTVSIDFCGTFQMATAVDEKGYPLPERRDGRFAVSRVGVDLGPRQSFGNFGPGCAASDDGDLVSRIVAGVRERVPAAIGTAFNASLWVREVPNGSAPFVKGSCSREYLPPFGYESGCAAAPDPEQDCHDFANGAGNDYVRTSCEQRAGDPRRLCYWNIEAERVEMMPSRLEVVVAEDDLDSTVQALDHILLVHDLVGSLCRDVEVEPADATISGTIEWRDVSRP